MSGIIRWLGHPFVEFTTTNDKVVIFGPWTKDDGNRAYHKFTVNRSMK
jgi:hypothetical protein